MKLKDRKNFKNIDNLYIVMGNQCNMQCRHCTQTPIKDISVQKQEIADEVWQVLDNFINFSLEDKGRMLPHFIVLWGGEPLVYWHTIKEIVSRCTEKIKTVPDWWQSVRFKINTNGLLLDKEKIDFINEHKMRVILSYDVPNPTAVRGNISEEKINLAKTIRDFATLSSFNGINNDYFLALRCLQKKFPKTRHIFNYNLWHTSLMDNEIVEYPLKKAQYNFKKLILAARMGNLPASLALSDILWRLHSMGKGEFFNEYFVRKCFSGTDLYSIKLNGEVLSCYNSDDVIGNVNQDITMLYRNSFGSCLTRRNLLCEACEHNDICIGNCSFALKDSDGNFISCNKYYKPMYTAIKSELKKITLPITSAEKEWFETEYEKDTEFVENF